MLRRSKTDKGGPIPADGASVLVVNDNHDALELVTRLLDHNGFRTSRSDDIDDAMVKIATSDPPIALVLVDFHQGGTSQGLKLLDRIRASDDERLARTRAVMTTDLDENRVFSWQSGVDGFLIRPYHARDLVRAITDALGRNDEERASHRQRQMKAANDPRSRRAAGEAI